MSLVNVLLNNQHHRFCLRIDSFFGNSSRHDPSNTHLIQSRCQSLFRYLFTTLPNVKCIQIFLLQWLLRYQRSFKLVICVRFFKTFDSVDFGLNHELKLFGTPSWHWTSPLGSMMEPFKIPWQIKIEKSSDFLPVLWRFGQSLADVEIVFKTGTKRRG